MVGINLPPDPSLALRADTQGLTSALSVAKLAALLPTGTVTDTVGPATGGPTVQQGRPGQVAGGGLNAAPGTAPASARETFSSAARVILDILEGTESTPLRGSAPLLPTPPGSGQATALASALARQVGQSGLFYESHLSQLLNGTRGLDSLLREPQAMLGRPPGPPAGGNPNANASANTGGGAPQPVLQLTYEPSASPAAPAAPVAPQTQQPAASGTAMNLAAAALGALVDAEAGPAAPAAPPRGSGGNTTQPAVATSSLPLPQGLSAHLAHQATQAYQAASAAQAGPQAQARHLDIDSSWRDGGTAPEARHLAAPVGPPVHPDATTLVRQQLDALATQQFRWMGEAWPGTPMDWQIRREPDESQARNQGEGPDLAAGVWSTRLVLEFPNLGTVEARLSLTGNGIEARLAAPDSVNRLNAARAQLQDRLAAAGLNLTTLAVDGILSPGRSIGS
ncbi:flagellar hook-length control protein FliK [Cupriavidus sp. 8B]